LRALERICIDAGFATTHKRMLTSEGNRRADLKIRNIRMAGQADLLVDVSLRHDFIGAPHRHVAFLPACMSTSHPSSCV
jgi:hypothetical protein